MFSMKCLSLEEIRQSQLETMRILRSFCEENKLSYYLGYGTLLGAVRHRGYIPWDDDVDIYMPRDDYSFLIEHFNENKIKAREVISKETCPEFYLNFAKIIDGNTVMLEEGQTLAIGVWIDIFPMDYVVDSKLMRVKTNFSIGLNGLLLDYLSYLKPEARRPAYKNFVIKTINRIIPPDEVLAARIDKRIDGIIAPNKSNTYGLRNNRFLVYGVPAGPKELFEPSVKLEFEGELFDAPKEYDKILKCFYGTKYMELPPENLRRSRHKYLCYWKEDNDSR